MDRHKGGEEAQFQGAGVGTGKRKEPPNSDDDVTAPDPLSRSERKKRREKKRRDDLNKGLDQLLSLVFTINPQVKAEAEERQRERSKPNSKEPESLLSRVELVNVAIATLHRVHQENEERKVVIAHLTKGLIAAKDGSAAALPSVPGSLPAQDAPAPSIQNPVAAIDRPVSTSNIQPPLLAGLQQQIKNAQRKRDADALAAVLVQSGARLPPALRSATSGAPPFLRDPMALGLPNARPGPPPPGGLMGGALAPPQPLDLLSSAASGSILGRMPNVAVPLSARASLPAGAPSMVPPQRDALSLLREIKQGALGGYNDLLRQGTGLTDQQAAIEGGVQGPPPPAAIDPTRSNAAPPPGDIAAALQMSNDHIRRAMLRDRQQREEEEARAAEARRSWGTPEKRRR